MALSRSISRVRDIQGSAIVVVRESWGAESALTTGPGKRF
jgi:hypothetical protein